MSSPMWFRPCAISISLASDSTIAIRIAVTPAQGYFQFITPTWQRLRSKAGVRHQAISINQHAPRDQAGRGRSTIPLREWGDRTPSLRLRRAFPWYSTSSLSQIQAGVYRGSCSWRRCSNHSRHHAQHAPAPARDAIANALTGGTGADGQGLSPIQQMQKDVSGEGGQALQPAPPPQLGPGDMHNAQVAPKRRN